MIAKNFEQLIKEVHSVQDEISKLYKEQDKLKKQLQEICLHENKIFFSNVEYSGMLQDIEYCPNCNKTIFIC
jgi:hypothetical protein